MLLSHIIQLDLQDAIDHCLDQHDYTIVNDLLPLPWVEYALDDLEYVWHNFQRLLSPPPIYMQP